MKLYYTPGACSLSPHIVLLEAGLPYDLVKVDLRAKKLENGDDYLKVNPKGQVPALALDGGELVTEGPVIVQMLADKAPGKNRHPHAIAPSATSCRNGSTTSPPNYTRTWARCSARCCPTTPRLFSRTAQWASSSISTASLLVTIT